MADVVKNASEIESMTRINLITYAKDLGNSFIELKKYLLDPDTGIITKLQQQLELSQAINKSLLRQLSAVERQSIMNSQYARKETLELHGVPASFDDNAGLETNVIALLNEIAPAAKVEAIDVQAIHRLNKRDRVIIKFISRKKKHDVLTRRAKLKEQTIKSKHRIEGNIFLNESMCPQIKRLHYLCKKLKQISKIHYYTFFNGNLRVQVVAEGEKKFVSHITDLEKLTGLPREEIELLE